MERAYLDSSSFYHFPGQLVNFYPSIRELKSERDYTCFFSGAKIKEGSFYYYYRPLLEVINNGKTYVLQKTIKIETSYLSYLPQNMNDFDIFTQKVEHYYNYPNEELDYEQINYYCGGSINLLELKKKGSK